VMLMCSQAAELGVVIVFFGSSRGVKQGRHTVVPGCGGGSQSEGAVIAG
jgi:hypothetical protein